MLSRICPRHGSVPTFSDRCPNPDCGLPLLGLNGGEGQSQQWRWADTPYQQPEVKVPKPHKYAGEMQALWSEGFDDQQIIDWFKPLHVALTLAIVDEALVPVRGTSRP